MVRTRSRVVIVSGEASRDVKKTANTSGSETHAELVRKHDAVSDENANISGERRYFLMKSEGESRIVAGQEVKFSTDDLENMPEEISQGDGVRNYQARNIMREMKKGDFAFFYHSNCKPAGIVGIVTVVEEANPDHTQFDEKNLYYDSKSSPEDPRWFMVDVKLVRRLKRLISLEELKQFKQDKLKSMMLLKIPECLYNVSLRRSGNLSLGWKI
uniref:Thymocyte nuclear protein 1 n=1 Tax=Rhodosorus marinus TaxID=101924 RepID=A0A7S0G329_9RHOD|mmetsp:Transcript_24478/g.35328  ORF Transcript_24478/g.35328 Transcript_24478/m.35328 type:complete len:214 (+) Transcript_24478:95-736(+)